MDEERASILTHYDFDQRRQAHARASAGAIQGRSRTAAKPIKKEEQENEKVIHGFIGFIACVGFTLRIEQSKNTCGRADDGRNLIRRSSTN
jgi:hypothetical protein